jgi:hypothetical protein
MNISSIIGSVSFEKRTTSSIGEKICFILDEANVLQSSFLERMNTLLANGEVPGLFEGDEFTTLMTQCKEGAAREGLMHDSVEELYKWFAIQVMKNLHVVFTMNPSEQGLKDRAATSPALFNRCVLDWFGDWTNTALFQVAKELTMKVDLESNTWKLPLEFPIAFDELNPALLTHRDAIINSFVFVHLTLHKANKRLSKRGGRTMAITPRHFLDFISHFVKLYNEKRSDLEEQQLHLNIGLNKIAETVEQVEEMKKSLELKRKELKEKDEMANNKLKEMIGKFLKISASSSKHQPKVSVVLFLYNNAFLCLQANNSKPNRGKFRARLYKQTWKSRRRKSQKSKRTLLLTWKRWNPLFEMPNRLYLALRRINLSKCDQWQILPQL